MRTFGNNFQNLFTRWLMSAAVLFYVLVPQVGICHCGDQCSCKPMVAAETKSCCCNHDEPLNNTESEAPRSCPCVLKPVYEHDQMIHTVECAGDELKTQSFVIANIPTETLTLCDISLDQSSNQKEVAALPVRLHLFLQVLLI
jgi:hypothetical protein